MPTDLPLPELPEELTAKIHEIALKTGRSEEEIIADVLRLFVEMVDNARNETDTCLVQRIRNELRQKFGSDPE